MKQFSYQIEDPNGLHARPAGQLVSVAKRYACAVRVRLGEKEVDGKRLLAMMSLGALHGSELRFTLDGTDEDEAARALEAACRALGQQGVKNGEKQ